MRPLLIGLTGQTGAGKSGVSDLLAEYGFDTINADLVAREVVAAGSPCLAEIVALFGPGILLPDGSMNRRAVGDLVFSDPEQRHRLEAVIFPYITRRVDELVQELGQQGRGSVFLDAPTLFESGINRRCDRIVSVLAPLPLRLQRIMARDALTREQAMRRIESQYDDGFYTARSDYVIHNDQNRAALRHKVEEMLTALSLPRPE